MRGKSGNPELDKDKQLGTSNTMKMYLTSCFLGLSLQQSTDPKTLQRELEKLDRQLKELNLTHRTRYLPRDVKAKLKEHLASKVCLTD